MVQKSRHFQLTEKEYNKERKEGVQKWHRDRGSTRRNIGYGRLYVSAIFDCFDLTVPGLAMDDNMRAELCVRTLDSGRRAGFGRIICVSIIRQMTTIV